MAEPEIDGVGEGGGAVRSKAPTSVALACCRGSPARSTVPAAATNVPVLTAGELLVSRKSCAAESTKPGSTKSEFWSTPDRACHSSKSGYFRPFHCQTPASEPSVDQYRRSEER